MMSEVAPLPGNENLLNSVLSELKCRIPSPVSSQSLNLSQRTPPTPPPQESKPRIKKIPANLKSDDVEAINSDDDDESINGIAEYAVYCRNVGAAGDSNTNVRVPVIRATSPNESSKARTKPSVPPTKPVRRNKPVNIQAKPKPVFQRASGSQMSDQFRQLLESAFSTGSQPGQESPDKRSRSQTDPVLHHRDHWRRSSNTNTLKKEDFDAYFKQSLESVDSGLEGSSKSAKHTDDFEDCIDVEGIYSIIEQRPMDSLSVDQLELVSTLSGLSDERHHSHESGGNENVEENEDSFSSDTSGDELAETKVIVKRIKARERARQLKKQASAQKERVGAFLDAAASNASDRIKKFRRPSLKFSHGKNKTLQNLANKIGAAKHVEDHSPQHSASENEEGEKKTSLATSGGDRDNCMRAVKCGYLKKQGGKIKTWHERWFTLKGDQMHYYKDVDGKYLGAIYLSDARVISYPPRSNSNDSHKYIFEIFPSDHNRSRMNGNHESYVLSASSQADMEEWVRVIKRLILSPFGGGIFGQRLEETIRHDRRMSGSNRERKVRHQVPVIVANCIEFIRSNNGLKEEGLFRLPGHANEVKELQEAYDMGERPVFSKSTDVHTVASLLKAYLRELPEPVVPFGHYQILIEAAKLSKYGEESPKASSEATKEKEDAMEMIKEQIEMFPQPNYDLIKYLSRFLDEVQQHSSSNKMDVYNLSMVFGPNLMRARKEDALTMMSDASHVQHVVYQLIESHRYFFPNDHQMVRNDVTQEIMNDVIENGDAGIGTLTTTASPFGTLGPRHTNDDSGTGSLAPTPENTNKRVAVLPNVQPRRAEKPERPNKPIRSKISSHNFVNAGSLLPSRDEDVRKSFYDNVSTSPAGSQELLSSESDWKRKKSCDLSSEINNSTSQESCYVNNESTPCSASLRSSTHAVAGSAPESCLSSTTTGNMSDPQSRLQINRRPKIVRRPSRNLSDEESNTESLGTDDRPLSTMSSRSSSNNAGRVEIHPRTASCPVLKYPKNHLGASPSKRLSVGSGSDGASSNSSVPNAPARSHRRLKTSVDGVKVSQHSSHSILPPPSTRSSNMTSLGTSSSSRPLTYKEMEEQIRALKEEMSKQREEHERRSRMLEEHYVMKMRTSSSTFPAPLTSPDPYTPVGLPHNRHPSFSIKEADDLLGSPTGSGAFRSAGDDSLVDTSEAYFYHHPPSAISRAVSTESQAELRYREEMKRHAMTKIRLRNAERGLRQAEERNEQLQKEMENFFETFGNLLPQRPM